MKLELDIQSPAVKEAAVNASVYGLENHGLGHLRRIYWNLPTAALYEESTMMSGCPPQVIDSGPRRHTSIPEHA